MNAIESGVVRDLSDHQNHLRLGGYTEDYLPQRITVPPLLPSLPVVTTGMVAELDGQNDVIVIRNSRNICLGRYEQLTLEFWFKPNEINLRRNQEQILYTQGDAEAGLNVYLFDARLYVVAWCADYEQTLVQETIYLSNEIQSDQWYHVAVTNDELRSPDFVEFRAYLDGEELQFDSSTHAIATLLTHQKGYSLSPVGAAYLGGLGEHAVTRFKGVDSSDETRHLHYFAGQLTEFRLWKRVRTKTEIGQERFTAPTLPNDDLLVYLPLDEGPGEPIRDRSNNLDNPTQAILQSRNVALLTDGTGTELRNVYSHYTANEALNWTNYSYTGRLYLEDTDGGIGVTFFSRYPEQDRYYILRRYKQQPTFHLATYPAIPLSGTIDSGMNPIVNTWYRFRVEVTDNGIQTVIRAKVWQDGTPEPTAFQIDAIDASSTRLTSGTVGVWVYGEGMKRFDDLKVFETGIGTTQSLFQESFEKLSLDQELANWRHTGDRSNFTKTLDLFRFLPVDNITAFGTTTELQSVFSHYDLPAALNWKNYIYTGRLYVTDADSAIGVTFFSRYPAQQEQYYSLQRDRQRPTFHLANYPESAPPLEGSVDSTVSPIGNTWYRFRVEVVDTGSRTRIRAKVWQDGTPMPQTYQIDVSDRRTDRLTSGTVGVWAADSGAKYFDDLQISRMLLLETFSMYRPNEHPVNWIDTRANFGLEQDNTLFTVQNENTNLILNTRSNGSQIHSHYVGSDALNWKNYVYTGRMRTGQNGAVGITFLSRYPNEARYYRLRAWEGIRGISTFQLILRSAASDPEQDPPNALQGTTDSRVPLRANVWYRFSIEVEDTGTRTHIRGKVWQDGTPEPNGFQIDAYDDRPNRLTSGTVGIWASNSGSKFYDDLQVMQRGHLLPSLVPSLPPSSPLSATNAEPENWQDTGSRNWVNSEPGLFTIASFPDNALSRITTNQYPLLRHPLNQRALSFNGNRNYSAAINPTGLNFNAFTAEAWISPSRDQQNPVLGWQNTDTQAQMWIGVTDQGRLTLVHMQNNVSERVTGTIPIPIGQFTHVAITINATTVNTSTVTLYVNGNPDTQTTLNTAIVLNPIVLELGRDLGKQHFAGQIQDLRLWNTVRTADQFVPALRYQQPDVTAPELVGYWSFPEISGDITDDASAKGNHFRLGGLDGGREPRLVEVSGTGFWRRDRQVLAFNDSGDRITLDDAPEDDTTLTTRRRRTIEVWFKVNDITITRRKQVIYHEGDAQRGLTIYVHDGYLYFGGYNLPENESTWQGTWLRTDQIDSGKWYHAALVLDGRSEIRPSAFCGFLDGKLVDVGVGSQLWQHRDRFTLGDTQLPIRFHDGESLETNHYLQGQILDLRVWNTARTAVEITRDRVEQLDGNENHLVLWWQFDQLSSNNLQIVDLSNHKPVAKVNHAAQLQRLGALPRSVIPTIILNDTALKGLAQIRQLQTQYGNASIEQLTALWFSLRHVGREDGQPFFDRIFNPAGMAIEPWQYYGKICWTVTGNDSSHRAIRNRLMAALQVSSADLDRMVQHLSGSEPSITLDNHYLTRLYRLSQIPKVFRLSVPDFLRLLNLLNLTEVDDLDDLVQVNDRVLWMQRTGITVNQLGFLLGDGESDRISLPYTDTSIRDLADSLTRQSSDFLIREFSFINDEITESQSRDLFQYLHSEGVLEKLNETMSAVTTNDQATERIELDTLAILLNWNNELNAFEQTLREEIVQRNLPVMDVIAPLRANRIVNPNGVVQQNNIDLSGVFSNPDIRTEVEEFLQRRGISQDKIQNTLSETLVNSRTEHTNTVLASLSELLNTEPDRLQSVIEYFSSSVSPTDFLRWMMQISNAPENQPIPTPVTDYLYQPNKIVYLANQVQLSPTETTVLLQDSDRFSVSNVLQPNITDLDHLFTFTELKTTFNDINGQLISLLSLPSSDREAVIQGIVALTQWDRRQLETLIAYFGSEMAYNRIEFLNRLQQCFTLAQTLAVDIEFLIQLADTSHLTLDFYRQQSDALFQVLRARYTDDQWQRVYPPIRDPLATQKRDALLSLALQRELGLDYEGRRDPDVLYEYLLLDVQTGSEVQTSRIAQGIASLQLYVQRCLMNLEKGVNPGTIPTEEWDWMKNYRVWEANRKVFLYPENYIEPELRDTKTPLFEELEQELMQGEIDQTNVEKVFANYLNKLTELADLKIVGAYRHQATEQGLLFRVSLQSLPSNATSLLDTNSGFPRELRAAFTANQYPLPNSVTLVGINPQWTIVDHERDRIYIMRLGMGELLVYDSAIPEDSVIRVVAGTTDEAEALLNNSRILSQLCDAFAARQITFTGSSVVLRTGACWILFEGDRIYAIERVNRDLIAYVPAPPVPEETLYLVGRTTTQPSLYYYRELVNQTQWLSWKKIDLSINANFVTPVFAFNRLFLFWVEFTELSRRNPSSTTTRTVYRPIIRYSYPDFNGAWITPQTYAQGDRELEANEQSRPEWQRVYAVRTVGAIPTVDASSGPANDVRERILVIHGDMNAANTELEVRPLRNAREQEALTLQFSGSSGNTLDVRLSPNFVGQVPRYLGYMTVRGNLDLLNRVVGQSGGSAEKEQLRGILNGLFERPTDGSALQVNGDFQVARRNTGDQWAITIGNTRVLVRQVGDRLNVYQISWYLGYMTLAFLPILDDIAAGTAEDAERTGLQNILPNLFDRPTDFALTIQSNLRVEKLRNTQWIISYTSPSGNTERLLVVQSAGRLDVYRFSVNFLTSLLNTFVFVDLQSNVRIDILENNQWLFTGSDSRGTRQEFLLVPQGRDFFDVYQLPNTSLYTANINAAGINEYALATDPGQTPIGARQTILGRLPLEASLLDVNNQAGWYILDTGEEQFLLQSTQNQIATDTDRLVFTAQSPNTRLSFQPIPLSQNSQFSFTRLDTTAVRELSLMLFEKGIDGLLSLRSQQTPEHDFSNYGLIDGRVVAPNRYRNHSVDVIDFDGPFGSYYWEIFFHIPFFIANQLNTNQRFTEAQNWYHYIFNPTTRESLNGSSSNADRYWQYLPFRNLSLETLNAILNNSAALAEYRRDPFDPHAIAQLRINAYQKAIVMKYIDNLLDWGDYLFNQNTRESIGEAAQLYVLAYNLLGPHPEGRANRKFEDIGNYNGIREAFTHPPEFLADVSLSGTSSITLPQNGSILTTFCVTENTEFVGFWDRVSDRLFKIRHSLNIDGVFRQLDLFQPALAVRALVAAFASGNRDISSILADVNCPVPHYRYGYMLDKAKEMTEIVISLGEKLLEVLQNRDAEQLATLQNTHERNILDLMTATRAAELDVVRQEIQALQLSKQSIQTRQAYYDRLLQLDIALALPEELRQLLSSDFVLSNEERMGLDLASATIGFKSGQSVAKLVASIAGFASIDLKNPKEGIKNGFDLLGDSLGAVGDALSTSAGLVERIAEYKRRTAEWQQERSTIAFELREIDQQLEIANIRLQIAEHELTVHDRTIQNNQQVADFYRRKFTNEALYNWMISRISGLYFQAYKLAYATAKDAERAFQYEFGDNSQFINFGH